MTSLPSTKGSTSETEAPPLLHPREAVLRIVFAKIDVRAFAKASAAITSAILFFAIAVLLIQAPADVATGTLPGTLSPLLPGYGVTWSGALIGAAYGAVIGGVLGGGLAMLCNLSKSLYLRIVLTKSQLKGLLGETP